jgi:hypothetical protein
MGDDLSQMLRQILQQFVFGRRQMHVSPIHPDLSALEVQAKPIGLNVPHARFRSIGRVAKRHDARFNSAMLNGLVI